MKIAKQNPWENEFPYWPQEIQPIEEPLHSIDPHAVYEYAGWKRWDDDQTEKSGARRSGNSDGMSQAGTEAVHTFLSKERGR